MNAKPINYGRHLIDAEDLAAVREALESDFLTQGPRVKAFEAALCALTGAGYAVAVSNGTAALHLAALAAGLAPGDEGITSPITFAASANCLIYAGARPVFADIAPDTYTLAPGRFERHRKCFWNNALRQLYHQVIHRSACAVQEARTYRISLSRHKPQLVTLVRGC